VSVVVYNSLEFTRTQYQKLNVPSPNVNVTTASGGAVSFQVSEALSYGEAGYSLFIKAESIPPLGFKTFIVTPTQNPAPEFVQSVRHEVDPKYLQKYRKLALSYLENEYLSLGYNFRTGQIQSLESKTENYQISLQQNVSYYIPTNASQTSGAYIFRPADYIHATNTTIISFTVVSGPLVLELQTVYNESDITQVIRLYTGLDSVMGNYVDVEMHLGPLDVNKPYRTGKEVRTLNWIINKSIFFIF
jgi:PKD repeat protein